MSHQAVLTSLKQVHSNIAVPHYQPSAHKPGIVHIGLGAFHRAHQAVYTDSALNSAGGDWRIIGVSLRSTDTANKLNSQNGLYTLIERSAQQAKIRVIGSIAKVLTAVPNTQAIIEALADPAIKIVSLTVTEKAYGIAFDTGKIDLEHSDIQHDLQSPLNPQGVLGVICEALARRYRASQAPFTVLCCDNLPNNGQKLKAGVVDYSRYVNKALSQWIDEKVAFPSTMVDRITPAVKAPTYAEAAKQLGCVDNAALECEIFSQWVIEDNFPQGRPYWEAGGALFVDNIHNYEQMKLRLLNGAHSMLAYAGFLQGCRYVRNVMKHADLPEKVAEYLRCASKTLPVLAAINYQDYCEQLLARFTNPAMAHETYQIAMDGSQKLPLRIFPSAVYALQHAQDLNIFAYATAAWIRYCQICTHANSGYLLQDPRREEIEQALKPQSMDSAAIVSRFLAMENLFPRALLHSQRWKTALVRALDSKEFSSAAAPSKL